MKKRLALLLLVAHSSLAMGEDKLPVEPVIPHPMTPGVKINPPVSPLPSVMKTKEGAAAAAEREARAGARALNEAMINEAAGFDKLLSDKFSIALLPTSDPQVRGFIAQGMLKMNPDIYTRMESGLAALYVENGKINGQSRRVCYVLNNPDRALHLWRSFVPETARDATGIGWAARYLVAHEIGHCLDRWQRTELVKTGELSAARMSTLGVPTVAFDRTFGAGRTVSLREYQQQQVVLNRDGALLQYQERVADAFAVLWLMGQKAPNQNLKPIWDTRMRVAGHGEHHAHATLPALQRAYAFGMEMKTLPSLAQLWTLARKAQIEAGVDPSLGANSKLVHRDAEAREAAPGAKPGEISPKGVLPATIRFDKLPKFGSRK